MSKKMCRASSCLASVAMSDVYPVEFWLMLPNSQTLRSGGVGGLQAPSYISSALPASPLKQTLGPGRMGKELSGDA